jgi:hypothetical protein
VQKFAQKGQKKNFSTVRPWLTAHADYHDAFSMVPVICTDRQSQEVETNDGSLSSNKNHFLAHKSKMGQKLSHPDQILSLIDTNQAMEAITATFHLIYCSPKHSLK